MSNDAMMALMSAFWRVSPLRSTSTWNCWPGCSALVALSCQYKNGIRLGAGASTKGREGYAWSYVDNANLNNTLQNRSHEVARGYTGSGKQEVGVGGAQLCK